ncbi:YveK family protein [Paenibacillus tarimensis]|uniref:YveK family protein n=2 Tax=Paenibacillus tarimensis TaxID=416012 RepID=UPI0039F14393|nr:Wzz/FepE/Etk N-terminal domain-containing protein [Paenibacillus tarimensis]
MNLDMKDLLRIIRKRAWIIGLLIVIAGSAVGFYSYQYIEPVYEASSKVIVNKTRIVEGVEDVTFQDLNAQVQMIGTYKEVVRTPWLLDDVVQKHPELQTTSSELASKLEVSSPAGTQVMTFKISDTDYSRAANMVNAVTSEFVAKMPEVMIDNLTVLNRANPEATPDPVSPNPELNIVIAVVLALIAGVAIVLIVEYFDDSIQSEEVVRDYLDLPTLAVINHIKASDLKGTNRYPTNKTQKAGEANYAAAKS